MAAVNTRQHIDPEVDSAPKSYQPSDYVCVSLLAFSVIFLLAMFINHSFVDGTTAETCAAKYAFDANLIEQAVNNLKETMLRVAVVAMGGFFTVFIGTLILESRFLLPQEKNSHLTSLLFDPEMQKQPWEKPYAIIAVAIASVGIAILLSTVLIQYCPGMQALNDYYAGCKDSGYGMCAVDMRGVYASMDRLAGWNSYWDVMVVTGTMLASVGALSFWRYSQRHKNREPAALQLDAVRGHDVSN